MHELFEHTADLGLRATAPDLDTLFAEMAACLFTAVLEDETVVKPSVEVEVVLPPDGREYLLFDWLNALLRHFDSGRLLFGRFQVAVGERGLAGRAWGEPFDAARHRLTHEVKAITYHELKVEPTGDGWLAEVIVDI